MTRQELTVARADKKKKSDRAKSARNSKAGEGLSALMSAMKIFVVVTTIGAAAVGFAWLSQHVPQSNRDEDGIASLILIDPPIWLNDDLKTKIAYAAITDGENLAIDRDAAASVQTNLAENFVWLAQPRVRVTSETVEVRGKWRRPLALIRINDTSFYLDTKSVLLDHVEVPALAIVEIKGFANTQTPTLGQKLDDPDIAAAMAILLRLARMDRLVTPNDPLMAHIGSIDMANFQGANDADAPHIKLFSKKDTAIIWGVELGQWSQHLEASDEQKLARLYGFFKEVGSLDDGVQFINLSDPRGKIPLPIDSFRNSTPSAP